MVVSCFENNNRNICGMAKKFNIEPKQVCDWFQKKEKLLNTAPHVAKLHPEKPPNYLNLEDDLFSWITEKRENGNAVTRDLITRKAIALSKDREFQLNNPGIVGFKFSSKWLDGFLERYDLGQRCRITVAQQLPSDLIKYQQSFLSYVLYMRTQHQYPLKYIGNMDETPM